MCNSMRFTQRMTNVYHLLPGVDEAHAVERDLADERVVGHHHGDGAEEHLQVIGQLLPARVARVHGDEDGTCWIQGQLRTLEHEAETRTSRDVETR